MRFRKERRGSKCAILLLSDGTAGFSGSSRYTPEMLTLRPNVDFGRGAIFDEGDFVKLLIRACFEIQEPNALTKDVVCKVGLSKLQLSVM